MNHHQYCVYIITNRANTVFYIGVTSNLQERILQHKEKAFKGFSSKYECNKLVYFEDYQWVQDAIAREKQLKSGSRQNKINIIVNRNPSWADLSAAWYE